jgi:hypothetical protein
LVREEKLCGFAACPAGPLREAPPECMFVPPRVPDFPPEKLEFEPPKEPA